MKAILQNGCTELVLLDGAVALPSLMTQRPNPDKLLHHPVNQKSHQTRSELARHFRYIDLRPGKVKCPTYIGILQVDPW